MLFRRRNPHAPWLTETSVGFISSWLRSGDRGLELGSGQSTLWFANRVRWLVSLEHDARWYDRTSGLMRERGIRNVEYVYRPDVDSYARFVEALPDGSFDFILLDGGERDRLAPTCASKLKIGGLLIVDNANWYLPHATRAPGSLGPQGWPPTARWQVFADAVADWRVIWTSDGVTDTALFVKPSDAAVKMPQSAEL